MSAVFLYTEIQLLDLEIIFHESKCWSRENLLIVALDKRSKMLPKSLGSSSGDHAKPPYQLLKTCCCGGKMWMGGLTDLAGWRK